MSIPTNEQWIASTKPLVQDRKLDIFLTHSVPRSVRKRIEKRLQMVDDQIGLNFSYPSKRKDADVIVRYVDGLPGGADGWARYDGKRWNLEVANEGLNSFFPDRAAKIVCHELGHALGLEHHDQYGLMFGSTVGLKATFSAAEVATLNGIWG